MPALPPAWPLGGRPLPLWPRALALAVWVGLLTSAGCGDTPPAEPPARADHPGEGTSPPGLRSGSLDEASPEGAAGTSPSALPRATNRRPAEAEGRAPAAATPAQLTAYQQAVILGDSALYSGAFETARDQYLAAMELEPGAMSPALGALRALQLPGQGEPRADVERTVRRKIKRLRERDATRGAADLLSARLAIALGRVGDAMDRARLAVARMPDLGVAWRVLGEAALLAERWAEAVRAFSRAAELGLKAKAGTFERLADAFDELGELDRALEAAEKALAMTGGDPNARRRRLNLLAAIRKHRGDLDGAAAAATAAYELGEADPPVLHNLGAIAEARGDRKEARRRYEAALTGGPYPMASWRLGHLHLQEDRLEEGLRAFVDAAAHLDRWTWPRSTRWWPAYEAGKLFARAGQYREAAGWFDDALREAHDVAHIREIRSWRAFVEAQAGDGG